MVGALPTQSYLPTMAINKILIDAEGFVWYDAEGYWQWRDDGYIVLDDTEFLLYCLVVHFHVVGICANRQQWGDEFLRHFGEEISKKRVHQIGQPTIQICMRRDPHTYLYCHYDS